jgi:hypothetical protein
MLPRFPLQLACGVISCVAACAMLTACAADRDYRPIPPGEGPNVPRRIQLREEQSISTVHFPRGVYQLTAEDKRGYYYRAPRQVVKHEFAGFAQYEGGIFIEKRRANRARGYLVWAGGRTKIGELSQADLEFGD